MLRVVLESGAVHVAVAVVDAAVACAPGPGWPVVWDGESCEL